MDSKTKAENELNEIQKQVAQLDNQRNVLVTRGIELQGVLKFLAEQESEGKDDSSGENESV